MSAREKCHLWQNGELRNCINLPLFKCLLKLFACGVLPTPTDTLLCPVYSSIHIHWALPYTDHGMHVCSVHWSLWSSRSITGAEGCTSKKNDINIQTQSSYESSWFSSWYSSSLNFFLFYVIPVSSMIRRLQFTRKDSLPQDAAAAAQHQTKEQCSIIKEGTL